MKRTCQKSDKVLDVYFVAPIVNLNVFPIEVNGMRLGGVNSGGKAISGIARDVVCEHEDDIRVRNAETLYCSVPIGWEMFRTSGLLLIELYEGRTSREYWPYAATTRTSVPYPIDHQ